MIMENMTYKQAVERLEEIMEKVQNGKMELDELSEALTEASALAGYCRGKLFKVDEEIKAIIERSNSL